MALFYKMSEHWAGPLGKCRPGCSETQPGSLDVPSNCCPGTRPDVGEEKAPGPAIASHPRSSTFPTPRECRRDNRPMDDNLEQEECVQVKKINPRTQKA